MLSGDIISNIVGNIIITNCLTFTEDNILYTTFLCTFYGCGWMQPFVCRVCLCCMKYNGGAEGTCDGIIKALVSAGHTLHRVGEHSANSRGVIRISPWPHIDGLVQSRRTSSTSALELRLSCTNPSTCAYYCGKMHVSPRRFVFSTWRIVLSL